MRILVTGAAGLVGSQVVLRARARGHEVHGTFHAQRLDLPCAWHLMDSGDPASVASAFAAARPEVVVDCAA